MNKTKSSTPETSTVTPSSIQRGLLVAAASLALAACAIDDPAGPAISEADEEATVLVFYEKFDALMNGPIGGQNGWQGDCIVSGSGDKYLACPGNGVQRNAQRSTNTGLETWGSYYMQYDVWMNGVVDGTHGKLFIEGPQQAEDTVLQVINGCGGIRAVFGYYGSTARQLISFPCTGGTTPRYRVICTWQSWATGVYCGAAVFPADPTWPNDFVFIPAQDDSGLPEEIPAFDKVRVLGGIGGRPGTTNFDKIYIERN